MQLTSIPPPVANRRRSIGALFGAAALMHAAMTVASAASTITAAEQVGTAWAGLSNAAAVAGTALGAFVLTRVMNGSGRRRGLGLGYVAAAAGAGLATVAVAVGSLLLLGVGMLLLGLGNAGAQLSRYAASELYPPERRGFAIGLLVWAGTIGAVGGPLLLAPAGEFAGRLGWATLAGPFAFAVLAAALAALASAGAPSVRASASRRRRAGFRGLLATRGTRSALAVMATGQLVMVAVMTAAPLDLHQHGHGMGAVGLVLSAHTFGMFALSPLTGRLIDRFGSRPVMVVGLATLTSSTLVIIVGPDGVPARTLALFLLGYAWNLCFVGGSGHLAGHAPADRRSEVEGAVDSAVWGVAAIASIASTALLGAGGYVLLAAVATCLVAVPALSLLHDTRRS